MKEKKDAITIRHSIGWWRRIGRSDPSPVVLTQVISRELWAPGGGWTVAARFGEALYLSDLFQAMVDGEKEDVAGAVYLMVSACDIGMYDAARRIFDEEVWPSLSHVVERRRARRRQHMIEQARWEEEKRKDYWPN